MRVGFAQADITPVLPITLSGFVFRMNQPAMGVDDPLFVRALALDPADGDVTLLLSFDLLGLGPELTTRIAEGLAKHTPGDRICLVCTHTHGAPATVHLESCGIPSESYWEQVVAAAVRVGKEATASLSGPVTFEWQVLRAPGISYNRRKVLADGRVVMARRPDATVIKEGPLDDTLFLGRFVARDGGATAGIAHLAAHACTVCSDRVTGDYPGALCAELSRHFGAPFLFLPGACGDVNPESEEMVRPDMLRNVAAMMDSVRRAEPVQSGRENGPISNAGDVVELPYTRLPSVEALGREAASLERIAAGDVGSAGGRRGLSRLGNVLNVGPGAPVDLARAQFAAQAMAVSLRRTLAQMAAGTVPRSYHFAVKVLRIGSAIFPIIPAEVFSETGIALARAFPGHLVRTVGYGSPLCGYLATAEAMKEGGYEVDDAYVFYGHPAPFSAEAECLLTTRTIDLIAATLS